MMQNIRNTHITQSRAEFGRGAPNRRHKSVPEHAWYQDDRIICRWSQEMIFELWNDCETFLSILTYLPRDKNSFS